jgi:hypothetical protein
MPCYIFDFNYIILQKRNFLSLLSGLALIPFLLDAVSRIAFVSVNNSLSSSVKSNKIINKKC